MDLHEWNKLQTEIFTQYNITDMGLKNIIEFNQICCFISYLRKYDNINIVKELMGIMIENELMWYNKQKEGE